jgi:uncharacterized membrane protein YqhA
MAVLLFIGLVGVVWAFWIFIYSFLKPALRRFRALPHKRMHGPLLIILGVICTVLVAILIFIWLFIPGAF